MTAKPEPVEIAKLVRQLLENLPAHLDMARFQAKLMRARYLELLAQGFTEQQALDLCWRVA